MKYTRQTRERKVRCAPALIRAEEAPAAPGWHPQDAPVLVALAFGSSATAIRTTGNQKI